MMNCTKSPWRLSLDPPGCPCPTHPTPTVPCLYHRCISQSKISMLLLYSAVAWRTTLPLFHLWYQPSVFNSISFLASIGILLFRALLLNIYFCEFWCLCRLTCFMWDEPWYFNAWYLIYVLLILVVNGLNTLHDIHLLLKCLSMQL